MNIDYCINRSMCKIASNRLSREINLKSDDNDTGIYHITTTDGNMTPSREFSSLQPNEPPNTRYVSGIGLTKYKGMGIGKKLYGKAAFNAYKDGINIFSNDPFNRTSDEAKRVWQKYSNPKDKKIYNIDNLNLNSAKNSNNPNVQKYINDKINKLNLDYNNTFKSNIHSNGSTNQLSKGTYQLSDDRFTIDLPTVFKNVKRNTGNPNLYNNLSPKNINSLENNILLNKLHTHDLVHTIHNSLESGHHKLATVAFNYGISKGLLLSEPIVKGIKDKALKAGHHHIVDYIHTLFGGEI